MDRTRFGKAVLAIALVGAAAGSPVARAEADCAPADHPGGDWPSLNHDLHNTRSQPQETVIGPGNVAKLQPAFTFAATAHGGRGPFQATPTIAGGCIYIGSGHTSGGGGVFAANADTGELVWAAGVPGGVLGTTVQDGRLYVGSYSATFDMRAQALDAATGDLVWRSERLTDAARRQDGEVIHASPVVFDGMYIAAVSRGIGEDSRPPMYFFDAATGEVLKRIVAVSEEDYARGYTGAGVWSTGAVDTENKVLYVATADSEAFKSDHAYNNAILKIDADRDSPTFGQVLGSYKGETEHYVDGVNLYDQPACTMLGHRFTGTSPSSSLTCLELDLDFGASVNLFTEDGKTIVGALQKSGVYHAIDGETMTRAWRTVASYPSPIGNASTAAVDANGVYATANPNAVWSLSRSSGLPQWSSRSAHDVIRYQPMTVANGVAYTVSTTGVLMAFDAANGLPLWQRSMSTDTGGACSTQGSGVAVARNTVYAQCDDPGVVVAYRIPGAQPL